MSETCGFRFETTYTSLPQAFFTNIRPEPCTSPEMVLINHELARHLSLDFSHLSTQEQAALFTGQQWPESTTPFAQAYAGHQFGHFTMLGDGRAHILGEHVTATGQRYDIQLKGSGRTPYSRQGDGRATLTAMLREYLVAEAMHHLGVPTTRALAVATTGEILMRDEPSPGAVLTRVADSHIRVGTFEFAARQADPQALSSLMDYTIKRHYPELAESRQPALDLLKSVMARQVRLIVHWMRIGFIHGVMNTDNMTLSGETLDYGPCAFMDTYHPHTVFSAIDCEGRYAYTHQPRIAQWNLARLAETLIPLIDDDENQAIKKAEAVIHEFPSIYRSQWLPMMRSKLGLLDEQPEDEQLITDLLHWMQNTQADYTNTFDDLTQDRKPSTPSHAQQSFESWYLRWQTRRASQPESLSSSQSLMQATNPRVIPRNHQVHRALEAATHGDLKPFQDLLAVLQAPYTPGACLKDYQAPPQPHERVTQTFCGT